MIDNLKAMLAKGQDGALLRFSLGNEHLKANEFAAAIEHLQQAVAHDPQYSAAWKQLGRAQLEAGAAEAAAKTLQHGLTVAEGKGDQQALKEMRVYLKRAERASGSQ